MTGLKSALIVYWSNTGNTEKVAFSIRDGLESAGLKVEVKKPLEAAEEDFYSYDLVCVGSPSIEWQPAKPMADLLKAKLNLYRSQEKIKPCAPKVAGKNALVFCTYSGPHTGMDEATPAGKTMRQYFEHFGFTVVGEWYVVGEFHGREDLSTLGRLGDIRGKPTAEDLAKIKKDAEKVAKCMQGVEA
ncbi:MAG TPA: flavodoxin domain-containing protein [Candidatus Limnocylindrales bacterium]|nr:flavodoxin domain-containing protein [Candidatus Limnocylindrales bacterium]